MGISPSFPRKHTPVSYVPKSYFTCVGKRRRDDYTGQTTFFHKIQQNYWSELLLERTKEMEAKNKFRDMDQETTEHFLLRFPNFSENELSDLRLQFQTFDLNQDNLIDYKELMQVLDDLGDTSGPERREQYFQEVDEDGSGAIDFEEFIGLIHRLQYEQEDDREMNNLGLLCKLGGENLQTLRKISLSEKLLNGLF